MKKRVVFVINNFVVGGVERFLRDILSCWDHDQVELVVISVWGSGVLVDSYRKLGIPIYWAGSRMSYSSKSPFLKLYFTIITPLTWCRLMWLLWRLKPTAVLTCLTQADIIGISVAWVCKVPVRIIRQADVKQIHPLIRYIKQKIAVSLSTAVIANSAPTGEFMQKYFRTPAHKVIVIPNGIDLTKFTPIATQPIRIDQTVIGFLGRLESIKGIQYFVSAIDLLNTKYNLLPKVVVFGDGSLREELENYAITHQLTNISWRGEVLRPESVLSEIDILVMPSQSEGFGFVLLEGLASGRVVVASDLPSFHYIVQSEDVVSYFPVGDSMGLAKILAQLLNNPQSLPQIQTRTNSWVIQHGVKYGLTNSAKQYWDVLLSSK